MSLRIVNVNLWLLFVFVHALSVVGEETIQEEIVSPQIMISSHSSVVNVEEPDQDTSPKQQLFDPTLANFEDKLKKMGKKIYVEPGSYSILNDFSESEVAELGTFAAHETDSDDGWVVTILGVCCILAALSFFIWCVLYIMDYTSNEMLENEKDFDDETVEDEQELEDEDEIEDEEEFDDEELYEDVEVEIETAQAVEAH